MISFSASDSVGTDCPDTTVASQAQPEASETPRTDASARLRHITDDEREAAIKQAGDLVEHYMAKYESTSDLQYRGDADRALRMMEILIAGRSAEQVRAMEIVRGLT